LQVQLAGQPGAHEDAVARHQQVFEPAGRELLAELEEFVFGHDVHPAMVPLMGVAP
jgi:hypothetical protein